MNEALNKINEKFKKLQGRIIKCSEYIDNIQSGEYVIKGTISLVSTCKEKIAEIEINTDSDAKKMIVDAALKDANTSVKDYISKLVSIHNSLEPVVTQLKDIVKTLEE